MSPFKREKVEVQAPVCCCGGRTTGETPPADRTSCCGETTEGVCCVKVLGSGCSSCHALYENVCEAVKEAGLAIDVEYVTDIKRIMSYGVMSMPALVVNEKVVSVGRVLKAQDIVKLLKQY